MRSCAQSYTARELHAFATLERIPMPYDSNAVSPILTRPSGIMSTFSMHTRQPLSLLERRVGFTFEVLWGRTTTGTNCQTLALRLQKFSNLVDEH